MKIIDRIYYPEENKIKDSKGRVFFYDNLRFMLIVMVVLRHFFFRQGNFYRHGVGENFEDIASLYMVFLWFLMPLFIFVTGFYAKGVYDKVKGFRINRIILFVVLYVVMDGLIYFENFFIACYKSGTFSLSNFDNYEPWYMSSAQWYLFACAVWFLFIPFLSKLNLKIVLPISLVLGVVICFVNFENDSLLSIIKVFGFGPFFVMGYYIKKEHMDKLLNCGLKVRLLALIIIVLVFVNAFVNRDFMVKYVKPVLEAKDDYYSMLSGTNVHTLWLFRILWYGLCFLISASVLLLIPRIKFFWTDFGARTLQVYIWHSVLVRLVVLTPFYYFLAYFSKGIGEFLMVVIVIAISLLLSIKPLKEPFDAITKLIMKIPAIKKRGV